MESMHLQDVTDLVVYGEYPDYPDSDDEASRIEGGWHFRESQGLISLQKNTEKSCYDTFCILV